MTGTRPFLRPFVAIALVMATLGALESGGSAASPVNYQSFTAIGTVSQADSVPSTSQREGFVLNPVTQTTGGVDGAKTTDGALTVGVYSSTRYYRYDAAQNVYKLSDAATVLAGSVKAAGKYARVNGSYQLLASYVWSPPDAVPPPAPLPQPQSSRDYSLQRAFNTVGFVLQKGATVGGTYSDSYGLVQGNMVSYNNDHVKAIAAAHQGKLAILDTPYTKYYVQQDDGKFRQVASASELEELGAEIRAAGRYTWNGSDWSMYASYVWRPAPGLTTGRMQFHATAAQSSDAAATPTVYSGVTDSGDGQLNPGPFEYDLEWHPDALNPGNSYFDGTWTATRQENGEVKGTVSGSISGTWNSATGAFEGDAAVDGGTLRWAGLTGAGSVSGTALSVGGTAPTTIEANWNLVVYRTIA